MAQEKARRPISSPFGFSTPAKAVVITSTQLLALFTTPQIIVPAPRAGFANIFLGAQVQKPAGTAYNLTTATGLSVKYSNAAGLALGEASGAGNFAGFLDQTTTQTRWIKPFAAPSGNSAIAPVAAAPLVLNVLTAEITTGTGGLKVRAYYTVVPMVP